MEEFLKAMDGLPKIVKVLLAIFLGIIYTIYMVIRDILNKENILVVVLDIIFGTFLGFINWILNIVFILKDDTPVNYATLFNIAKPDVVYVTPSAEEPKAEPAPEAESKADDSDK